MTEVKPNLSTTAGLMAAWRAAAAPKAASPKNADVRVLIRELRKTDPAAADDAESRLQALESAEAE